MNARQRNGPAGWVCAAAAAFFFIPIAIGRFNAWMAWALSDGSGAPTYNVSVAASNLVLVAVPLALAIVAFLRRTGWVLAVVSVALGTTFGVMTCQAGAYLVTTIRVQAKVRSYEQQKNREREWQALARKINPDVAAYVLKYPERVHPTGESEFIAVDGLVPDLVAKHKELVARDGAILDPWGQPIRFGIDLDHDALIKGGSAAYGVWREHGSLVAVGVYSSGPDFGQSWNAEGGVIDKPTK
jgi:hypothetical protein